MLPKLYHAHHNRSSEDLPFWVDLAAATQSAILELGCGTGRVLIPISQAPGHRAGMVIGLEKDADMLQFLRMNLPAHTARPLAVVRGDFTAFHLALHFGSIVMPCNTYSTLTATERRATLACAARHLAPGGVFAAALPNPDMLHALPRYSAPQVEEIFPHPDDGEPVQVSSGWQRTRRRLDLTWHYDHLLADGQVERVSAEITHHLVDVETHREEFRSAGFSTLDLLGNFAGSPFTPDSDVLILVARN